MSMKALRKDEDIAAVPYDQPVLVDLGTEDDAVQVAPEAPVEPEKKVKEPTDDGVNVLKEQMKALEEATKRANDRAAAAEAEADRARRERQEAVKSQARTEEDAIQSSIAAAQAEQLSAKAALKAAFEAGDADALADAQARIGRAAADLREFEKAAAIISERKEAPVEQPRHQYQAPQDINAAIDANPQFLPTERDWLKKHPEALMDASRNKELEVAYIKATRKGLSRGTPDYFKFLETEMGYAAPEHNEADVMTAAPVTRNERGSDGRPSNGRVMLTPEQREIAKNMGVSEIEYARQVMSFEAARKADPDKYR